MYFSHVFSLLCVVELSVVLAAPTLASSVPYQLIENRSQVPKPWKLHHLVANEARLHLSIALKSHPDNDLGARLKAISTPGGHEYGQHMKKHELRAFTAPSPITIQVVKSWLLSFSDVENVTYDSKVETLSFDVTAKAANEMFKAKFGVYQNPTNARKIVRSLSYSLPQQLLDAIALVYPISYFPTSKPIEGILKREATTSPAPRIADLDKRLYTGNMAELLEACKAITPKCIAKLYNIDYLPPSGSLSGSTLAVAGFLEQWVNHTDVTSFVAKHGIFPETRASPGTFTVELINGGVNDESLPGIEATLDMEYSMPFIGSLPVVYLSTGGRPEALSPTGEIVPPSDFSNANEPYLDFLAYLLAKPDDKLPQVISISYTETEQTVPRDYAIHVCDLFGRLAARGVSVIDASGDGGIAGQNDIDCISNDGLYHPQFLPTFPASCPYVTAVGWTIYAPDEQGNAKSSGGFSNYFPVPDYQVASTSAYIASFNGQYEGLYNASGSGIPDIAMYGSRYETENGNASSGHHSGTSAGTPVFATMVALINDIRLRKGLPVLGWLNPMLYSEGLKGVFNDIVEGPSYGCGESFNTTVGWDAVTGLGTVDFRRLANLLG